MMLSRFANLTILLTGIVFFLVIAQNLLIPIAIAACIWYITGAIAQQIGRTGLPGWLCSLLASVVIIGFILFSIYVIADNIAAMVEEAPNYEYKMEEWSEWFLGLFDTDVLPSSEEIMQELDLREIAGSLAGGLGTSLSGVLGFAGTVFVVIIYTIFMLLEQAYIPIKWRASFRNQLRFEQGTKTMKRISSSVRNYISVKAAMSLLTAALSWLVMWLVGLDFAVFWAFIIFLFNFIPVIGSLTATILPVLFSMLQFETFTNTLIILVVIACLQFAVANLLEPRLLGRTLNISGLVVLISLSLWGAIWGIIGMILSVPIMVTLIIILSEFPSTRPIAVWLSADGHVITDAEWEEAQEAREHHKNH